MFKINILFPIRNMYKTHDMDYYIKEVEKEFNIKTIRKRKLERCLKEIK